MTLEAPSAWATPVESSPMDGKTPVEAIIIMRKDLAEFQQNSSKEAFRKHMREELRVALLQAFHRDGGLHKADAVSDIIEHLVDRGVIKPPSSWQTRKARRRQQQQQANGNGTVAAGTADQRLNGHQIDSNK
jgi:hypothetical protein